MISSAPRKARGRLVVCGLHTLTFRYQFASGGWTTAPGGVCETAIGFGAGDYNGRVATVIEALAGKLADLLERPGVYRFLSSSGKVIYVGKAKNLRSRVRSYIRPSADHPPRTAALVAEVADMETIVVDSEFEAFLLENHLVKKEKPRYNIVLRDDKNYPYLKLSIHDEYPPVTLVRRPRLDCNPYFRPF